MNESKLIDAAIQVRNAAYAPHSQFSVGCALLTTWGTVFTGCNVENGSYGLSICAERMAIGQLVASAERDISAMVADKQAIIETIVVAATPLASPCGACRQFIVEFGDKVDVVSVNAMDTTEIKRWGIKQLIPDHFEFTL